LVGLMCKVWLEVLGIWRQLLKWRRSSCEAVEGIRGLIVEDADDDGLGGHLI
jgi:hypothetical protein